MLKGFGLLIVMFTGLFLTAIAFANTPQEMQRLLDQANTQAKAQFDKNYPQPKAPVIESRSSPIVNAPSTRPIAPAPVAPTTPQWNQNQPSQNQPSNTTADTQNKPAVPNIYVPQNTADKSKNSQSGDSVFNIFK